MHDYKKQPLTVGDTIRNIESGWKGRIMSTDGEGDDLMLVCHGINWWTNTVDDDDKQWHAPADVVKVSPKHEPGEPVNAINLM